MGVPPTELTFTHIPCRFQLSCTELRVQWRAGNFILIFLLFSYEIRVVMSDSGVAESEEGTDSPKDSAEVSSSMPCCSWEDSPSGPGAGCFQQRDQEAPVLGGSCRRGRRRGQKNRTPGFYYRGAADNEGRRVVKNARERTRVRNINVAYTELRQMLGDDFKKKNNKLRTLNATIEYIECLFSEKKRLRAAPPCKV